MPDPSLPYIRLALLLLLSLPSVGCAQDTPPVNQRVDDLLQVYMDFSGAVGLSAGVVYQGTTHTYHKGLADREKGRVPTDQTIYEIGSITKVFTANILLQWHLAGKVRLTDSLSTYFPDLSAQLEGVQLHHLLTHTSGLSDVGYPMLVEIAQTNKPLPAEKYFALMGGVDHDTEPGTTWRYSNEGMSLVGHLLTAREGLDYAEGAGYEAVLQRYLLEPMALKSTSTALKHLPPEHLAQGYFGGQPKMTLLSQHLGPLAPGGALLSSLEDLLTVLQRYLAPGPPPFTEDLVTLSFRRHFEGALPALHDAGLDAMGAAWWIFEEKGQTFYWHGGTTDAFEAFIGLNPKTGVGVVLLSNTNIHTRRDLSQRKDLRFTGFDLLHALSP